MSWGAELMVPTPAGSGAHYFSHARWSGKGAIHGGSQRSASMTWSLAAATRWHSSNHPSSAIFAEAIQDHLASCEHGRQSRSGPTRTTRTPAVSINAVWTVDFLDRTARLSRMVKKTALLVDETVLDEARAILGTRSATETIDRALREVILRERRRELVDYFSNRSPEANLQMLSSWN
jgi:Arc/MetJ family transcription regulator